ncbi:MAG: NADH-quinone oxidoreductase subunit NuoH [Dehalococcoidia bacterium]|nr:NADH-quinone oxidoreductase subunit NuoH [Dehalococcoidia bacterium]
MSPWDVIYNFFPYIGTVISGALSTVLAGWAVYVIMALIGIIGILGFAISANLAMVWGERRIVARIQVRPGPNRVGPFGLLQPLADALKVLTKEDIVPSKADKWMHFLGPTLCIIPAVLAWAVIPFNDGAILTDLNIGVLYILAVSSLGLVGVFMAGWGSNNKYSLLAAMRTIAQVVSYEIPMVLSVLGVVAIVGSLSMIDIVKAQSIPFIVLQPLGFLVYLIAATAEINRSPFDTMEAESELIGGYHTEYSGMRQAMFYIAEYINLLVVSSIVVTVFLGGWRGPLLPPYIWFVIKLSCLFFFFVWLRGTLPRFRIDQVMAIAWKFLVPVAILNIFLTGIGILVWQALGR